MILAINHVIATQRNKVYDTRPHFFEDWYFMNTKGYQKLNYELQTTAHRKHSYSKAILTGLSQVDFNWQSCSGNVCSEALIISFVASNRPGKNKSTFTRLNSNTAVITTRIKRRIIVHPVIAAHSKEYSNLWRHWLINWTTQLYAATYRHLRTNWPHLNHTHLVWSAQIWFFKNSSILKLLRIRCRYT